MKVLVTGATGFLGKYVVKELVTEGYFVRAFGRNEAVGQKLGFRPGGIFQRRSEFQASSRRGLQGC